MRGDILLGQALEQRTGKPNTADLNHVGGKLFLIVMVLGSHCSDGSSPKSFSAGSL